ncbi:hypothetical protein TRFO_40965 [Tritrichomonas foetus]|uniref:Uncharacterized protein n=1 Tax=Tritrichomonas foetus TaxID=1144522 RepID=A0A1J4J6B3_9EUKA|nr:hypothetical protein TRFO_40965 [Tritrichomonas foetus]|eukprot:OHS92708.1 hypothetical protein TRFO_40965 [Tritrichomonas foetus]
MNDWGKLESYCEYLERAEKELNDSILQTQNEVMKLQDILDTISPVPVSEPKEEVRVPRANQNRKVFRGFDYKVQQQVVETSADPYGEFLDYLQQYKAMPKFDRSNLADRFTKRVMDFSRMTAAHLHNRMTPLIRQLNKELDKVLDADISQDNIRFRARYTTNRASKVAKEFERLNQEFGLVRRTEVLSREKEIDESATKKTKKNVDESPFEILANLTPKQLNALYSLRGNARRNLMSSIMKEKAEVSFLSFLRNIDTSMSDEEMASVLKAARRGFLILAQDPKAYALILSR